MEAFRVVKQVWLGRQTVFDVARVAGYEHLLLMTNAEMVADRRIVIELHFGAQVVVFDSRGDGPRDMRLIDVEERDLPRLRCPICIGVVGVDRRTRLPRIRGSGRRRRRIRTNRVLRRIGPNRHEFLIGAVGGFPGMADGELHRWESVRTPADVLALDQQLDYAVHDGTVDAEAVHLRIKWVLYVVPKQTHKVYELWITRAAPERRAKNFIRPAVSPPILTKPTPSLACLAVDAEKVCTSSKSDDTVACCAPLAS